MSLAHGWHGWPRETTKPCLTIGRVRSGNSDWGSCCQKWGNPLFIASTTSSRSKHRKVFCYSNEHECFNHPSEGNNNKNNIILFYVLLFFLYDRKRAPGGWKTMHSRWGLHRSTVQAAYHMQGRLTPVNGTSPVAKNENGLSSQFLDNTGIALEKSNGNRKSGRVDDPHKTKTKTQRGILREGKAILGAFRICCLLPCVEALEHRAEDALSNRTQNRVPPPDHLPHPGLVVTLSVRPVGLRGHAVGRKSIRERHACRHKTCPRITITTTLLTEL